MHDPHQDDLQQPPRGLRENSAATARELSEFLAKMKGKPPQEVLGVIAQSGLARGLVLSTVAITLLLLVGTAAPFAWSHLTGGSSDGKQSSTDSGDKKNDGEADKKTEDSPAAADAKTAKKQDNPDEDILKKLGIGETKTVPKNFSPLDNRNDDLFKDLK